jgi:hypothetical protein
MNDSRIYSIFPILMPILNFYLESLLCSLIFRLILPIFCFNATEFCHELQETSVGFREEGSVFSQCSRTWQESKLTLEEAYHPSPVSVLEPPFKEEPSSSSEFLESVSSDFCGEFIRTVTHNINLPSLVQVLSVYIFFPLWLGSWMQLSDIRFLGNTLRRT